MHFSVFCQTCRKKRVCEEYPGDYENGHVQPNLVICPVCHSKIKTQTTIKDFLNRGGNTTTSNVIR